jgi:hypothetical protein
MRRAKRGVKKLSQPRELQQQGTPKSLDQMALPSCENGNTTVTMGLPR